VNPRSSASGLWAVVPVKPLGRAKSRLARALRAKQRAALARSMLARTLDILASVDRIAGIAVVSSDLTVQDIARSKNAVPLAETESGLNAAVSQACAFVYAQGGSGALIVPIDLPLLTASDVESMIDLAAEPACVVIAPDRRDEGSNGLLLRPPQIIRPAFGPSSFQAHRARAGERGIPAHVYRSATIALDLDSPADLDRYRQLAPLLDFTEHSE
jgi:2-phospho-L-lactate guanylyltransferase